MFPENLKNLQVKKKEYKDASQLNTQGKDAFSEHDTPVPHLGTRSTPLTEKLNQSVPPLI